MAPPTGAAIRRGLATSTTLTMPRGPGSAPAEEITLAWWRQYQLPRLRRWIAARPVSSAVLTSRFADRLTDLSAAWKETCLPRSEDDVSTVSWDDVMSLPTIAAEIKPMQSGFSAVFTSKFCHFLLPKIYPVIDNAALGGSHTYKGILPARAKGMGIHQPSRSASSASRTFPAHPGRRPATQRRLPHDQQNRRSTPHRSTPSDSNMRSAITRAAP